MKKPVFSLVIGLAMAVAIGGSIAPTGVVAQTAPAPTPRAATSAELAVFAQSITVPGFSWDEYAVAGPYALVGYSTANSGGTAVFLQNSSGAWGLVAKGGGQFSAGDIVRYIPSMPLSVAAALYQFAVSQDQ
jgi:hypothetical protein